MKNLILAFLTLTLAITPACKKTKADPHVPPALELKSGGKYTSGDKTVTKQDTILVGVTVSKTEDDLKSYNVSFRYDGATSSTTFYNYNMTTAEFTGYEHDIKLVTRNQAGTEKWIFTILDRDGNVAQKEINLTVQ